MTGEEGRSDGEGGELPWEILIVESSWNCDGEIGKMCTDKSDSAVGDEDNVADADSEGEDGEGEDDARSPMR